MLLARYQNAKQKDATFSVSSMNISEIFPTFISCPGSKFFSGAKPGTFMGYLPHEVCNAQFVIDFVTIECRGKNSRYRPNDARLSLGFST